MKRLLILADTHGDTDRCMEVVRTVRADAVIHAGDCVRDMDDIERRYRNLPLYIVKGNNNIFARAPSDIRINIEGIRIFLTHGHDYRVKYELHYQTLAEKGKKENADLIIFGHTHIPYTDYKDGMTILNPGSLRFGGTYATAEINNGSLKTMISHL